MVKSSISDRQMVEDLKKKKPAGYRILTKRFQPRLLREAVAIYKMSHHDAEEIVNDVLLAVLGGIQSFEFKKGEADFQAWLGRILRNRVFDHIRRKGPHRRLFEPMEDSALEGQVTDDPRRKEIAQYLLQQFHDPAAAGDSTAGAAARLLADAVEQLEPWERVLLHCRAHEMPYDAIAGYTGKSVQQLKVYHSRVKKKLRRTLEQNHPEHFNRKGGGGGP